MSPVKAAAVRRPPKIPESVLVVIHTAELEVLLIERADRPGFWQSVTGSKDSVSESFTRTALREAAEKCFSASNAEAILHLPRFVS